MRKRTDVDPGKTPGTAEGGELDAGPIVDRAGKTPGAAEGTEGSVQWPQGQPPRGRRQGHLIHRQPGDPQG
jgi:hypothetical protein